MLKNKKILIVIMFFILLLILNTYCFATGVELNSDNSVTINGYTYVLDNIENYTYYLYNKNEDTLYACVHAQSSHWNCGNTISFSVTDNGNNTFTIISKCDHSSSYANYLEYKYNKETNEWDMIKNTGGMYSLTYSSDEYSFVYSPMNINNDFDIENSDFFYKTPLSRLAQIVEKSRMETTLQEVIRILPLIIVVVVFLVGLRKALQILLTVLRRCLII